MVPELPKDFDEFVDREVLPQYLFYDAGRKVTKGYCTHCGREVKIRNPHYGDVGECPFCRHPITYRSRKKGGNVHAKKDMQDSCRKQKRDMYTDILSVIGNSGMDKRKMAGTGS